MTETIVLDPTAVASGRTQLDITSWIKAPDGVDWGDAAITAYLADQSVGSNPVDYRIPNRIVTIPLNLKDGPLTFPQVRLNLQHKVGLIHREGGYLLRQVGSTNLYLDVVNATLSLGGSQYQAYQSFDVGASLQLECIPEFYGDEVTLTSASGTGMVAPTVGQIANYVTNPSFETDTVGSAPATWSSAAPGWFIASGATLTAQTSGGAQSGTRYMRIVTTTTSLQGAALALGVLPAGTYTASMYVKGGTGGEALSLFGGIISPGTGDGLKNFTATTGWVQQSITFVADGSTACYVGVRSSTGTAVTVFVDAVMVQSGSVTSPSYADGDTSGYFWTGTAHGSQTGQNGSINGNYPGRVRVQVSDTSGNDQHGLIWGFRSRYYDSAATAALTYEAESLTALDAAASFSHSGASGGSTMRHGSLPGLSWCPVVSTGYLTHKGSYRIWARVYSATATPSLRLAWDVGDMSSPTTNDSVQVPGAANFYIVDLGAVRLDANPVGTHRWQGVIQAYAQAQGDPIEIDKIWLQPLDESAGVLRSVQTTTVFGVNQIKAAGTVVDDATVGTVAWNFPSLATVEDGAYAQTLNSLIGATHYLKASGFGFAIPSGATISGITVSIKRAGSNGAGPTVVDTNVKLVKAGTVQATNKADTLTPWPTSTLTWRTYGSQTDLWGGTWTATDINNSGFGVVLSATQPGGVAAFVDAISITVYYTTSGGFATANDAVIYANRTAELRTEGMYRIDSGGTAYGPVSSVVGDLPRIPASGLEGRTVQMFAKITRGSISTLAGDVDAGLDSLSATVLYRPSYLFVA